MTAPITHALDNRLPFPEDRTSFVYGQPGDVIRTPYRTGLKLFTDEGATRVADVVTPHGVAIPNSTIYTQDDSLLPIFFGPPGMINVLYAQVVGGTTTVYPLNAFYTAQISVLPTLLHGIGEPPDELGVPGSTYIDENGHILYGPKGENSWPKPGFPLKGEIGPSGGSYEHSQGSPEQIWVIDHPLLFRPAVTTVDSAGMKMEGDVSYPLPTRVVIEFSHPTGGSALLS